LARYDALHTWRKQRAAQRGVESDVVISKKALWELAHRNPKTCADLATLKLLGDWQRSEYGKELLSVLGKTRRKR
jgi:ribonuclease D